MPTSLNSYKCSLFVVSENLCHWNLLTTVSKQFMSMRMNLLPMEFKLKIGGVKVFSNNKKKYWSKLKYFHLYLTFLICVSLPLKVGMYKISYLSFCKVTPSYMFRVSQNHLINFSSFLQPHILKIMLNLISLFLITIIHLFKQLYLQLFYIFRLKEV